MMVTSAPEIRDERVGKLKSKPMAEYEDATLEQRAIKAIRPIVAPLLWLLIIVLIVLTIPPVFVWGWHILGPEDMRWLKAEETAFLQQILLEFKEVLLGSTITASIMAFTMRSRI